MALWSQEFTVIDHKGTKFQVTSNRVSTAATAPNDSVAGDVWFNTSSNTAEVYDGSQWKPIEQGAMPLWNSPTSGGTYTANDLVNHSGVLYQNITGSNTDNTPAVDTTNWNPIGDVDVVPLWKSDANGGVYNSNDIVNRGGVLYKNKTGTNSDTTPNTDDTNWVRVDQSLGLRTSVGGGIMMRHNWPSVGWNLGIDGDGDDKFYSSNPSYRMIMPTTGSDAGILQLKGTATGTAGEKRTTVPEVVHAAFSPDSNFRLNGILNTDTFSSDWASSANSGTYLANALVVYNGTIYKNITGANTNTSGVNNTAMGYQSLFRNTGGDRNVAVGYYTLANVTTGNDNIGIGDQAGDNTTTGSNNISIGNGAQPAFSTTSNQVTIGNGSNNSFRINGTWTNASDRRLKKEINYTVPGLRLINKLKPADFIYLNNTNGKKDVGFIAQDVAQALEEVGYDHSDVVQVFDEEAGTLGVKYTSFIPLLTQAVQELDAALKKSQQALQEQQAAFDLKLAQQQKEIEELKSLIKGN